MRTLILGLLLVLVGGRTAACEEAIHAQDRALIALLVKVWDASSLAAIRALVRHDPEEQRDVGFGGNWLRFPVSGHAVTVWIDVVIYDGRIAAHGLRSLGGSDAWKEAARDALGPAAKVEPDGMELRVEHATVLDAYRKAAHAAFLKPPAPPSGSSPHLEALIDPLSDLTYGERCYESRESPLGRDAADALRLRGRVDALAVALKGVNPEGRLYAAQALLMMEAEGAPVPDDLRESIEVIRRLPALLSTCGGCFVEARTAMQVMADVEFLPPIACHIVERVRVEQRWVDSRRIVVYYGGTYVVRHRLVAPPRPDEPILVRGRLSKSVASQLFDFLQRRGAELDVGPPIFVADLGLDPPSSQPELIDRIRAEVPLER